MTNNPREVRAEFLLPHEVEAALTARPVVYLPLGSIEFHSAHLPIGLDGLTAAGVCQQLLDVRVASSCRPCSTASGAATRPTPGRSWPAATPRSGSCWRRR